MRTAGLTLVTCAGCCSIRSRADGAQWIGYACGTAIVLVGLLRDASASRGTMELRARDCWCTRDSVHAGLLEASCLLARLDEAGAAAGACWRRK